MADVPQNQKTTSADHPPGGELCERALVFTDIIGSTKLKQVLGERAGNYRILRHHEEARQVLAEVGGGWEVGTAGDGMFLSFDDPALAVRFALGLQRRLRRLWPDEPPTCQLRDRIGIHFGRVETAPLPGGTRDLMGLEVDRTSRLMSLAGADQILLSASAFDRARQGWTESLAQGLGALTWMSHGVRSLDGLEAPEEVFEVGETGRACLSAPGSIGGEIETSVISGWRPALGEWLPGSTWQLEQRLGGGPAEEVWRAAPVEGGARWVLRFCFRLDRLNRLRQRRDLFDRLMRSVEEHPNLVRMTAHELTTPPFYLAYEYVPGLPLPAWLEQKGHAATERDKVGIIAQLADALEAVHRAGDVHGDLNPGAILVQSDGGHPEARLSRLGIGRVVAEETQEAVRSLSQAPIMTDVPGPRLDGHFYLAPELLQGAEPSPQSDLYALGVVMYQLLIGDFRRPVTTDWSAQITDAQLRDDLSACLAAAPGRRLATAGELAVRLRKLDQRRRVAGERERLAFVKGMLRATLVALAVIGVLGWQVYRAEWQKDRARENEREAEQRLVRLQVALGNAVQDRGDGLGAALYHGEALRLASVAGVAEEVRARDESLHRLRIAVTLQQAPKLVQSWTFPSEVQRVLFHPEAEQVLTAHLEGVARLSDLATGRTVVEFRHGAAVKDVEFLHQGAHVLTAGTDGFLRWWDGSSARLLGEAELPAAADDVGVSPDGRWVVVVCHDHPWSFVSLFDAESREPRGAPLKLPEVNQIAFHPDSSELAVAGGDGVVRRRSLPDWNELPPWVHLGGEFVAVVQVGYSPDGTQAVTASHDGSAGLWEVATGRRRAHFWHDTWLTGASFSRDGTRILTTSFDATACLWSARTGSTGGTNAPGPRGERGYLLRLSHDHSVLQGEISPDQRRIVTACFDHGARLWDCDSGDPIAQLKHGGYVHEVRFHPDSRRVITSARDGSLKLWDLAGMVPDASVPGATWRDLPVLRNSEGTRLLAARSERQRQLWDTDRWEPAGAEWELAEGEEVAVLDEPGERVAVLDLEGRVQLRDSRTGQALSPWVAWEGGGEVRAACFLDEPTELLLLITDSSPPAEDRFLWMAPDGTSRWTPVDVGEGARLFLAPDRRTVVTSGLEHQNAFRVKVRRWDARSGAALGEPVVIEGSQGHPLSAQVAFHPRSGRLLLSPTDGSFDPRSAALVSPDGTIEGWFPHDDGVLVGAFSPNGQWLATASEDATVRLRELPGGRLVQVLSHRHQVGALAFSRDGRLVATGSQDHTARVWDPATGEGIPPLWHASPVVDLWFTPDGRHLVTVMDPDLSPSGGQVIRWPLLPLGLGVQEVKTLTELLSCRRLEALRPALPLSVEEFHDRWRDLSTRHPELFLVHPWQRAVWHATEARACAKRERWAAARDHWNEVAKIRTLAAPEARERDQAREKAQGGSADGSSARK